MVFVIMDAATLATKKRLPSPWVRTKFPSGTVEKPLA
jgi:hypothetical protein